MIVFVTGASGFVGSHLVADLTRAGHHVRALVRGETPLPANCHAVRGDLLSISSFAQALGGCDAVIHSAALLDPVPDERSAQAVNHRATAQLAQAAAELGVRTFVFVSSIAVLGTPSDPGLADEAHPCNPTTPYGRSKHAAELDLLRFPADRMRVAIVRPPTVYGPGDRRNFLALVRAIDSRLFLVPGQGRNRISFCQVRNLTAALLLVAQRDEARGLYHVADEPVLGLREAAARIAQIVGRPLLPIPFPRPLAVGVALACELLGRAAGPHLPLSRARLRTLTNDFALDCTRLAALGFRAVVSFEDGVREVVGWYREQGLLPQRSAQHRV